MLVGEDGSSAMKGCKNGLDCWFVWVGKRGRRNALL